uniref:Uncharacterized protein n=1 Tax=Nelumbo nucifera TaxID=4432 RepID=A0A822ZIW9_NELNU|nr:TPA_asm: hypothetical protein HUJ06_015971 [Nelumbo nucifera]
MELQASNYFDTNQKKNFTSRNRKEKKEKNCKSATTIMQMYSGSINLQVSLSEGDFMVFQDDEVLSPVNCLD